MKVNDDDLQNFEATGALPLPPSKKEGYVNNEGAQIRYALYGSGPVVILLHGGMGNSGNWGYQLPMLVSSGLCTILIDSRGQGRSTHDGRPFTYALMASDVLAVMDTLQIEKAIFVGWSDGACTSLILAATEPARTTGVFFFGCNMDPGGTKELVLPNPMLDRCLARHKEDYARLSATPDQFDNIFNAVGLMQRTEPNYTTENLAAIKVPVTIVQAEFDEFIKPEHARYLAESIPNAELIILPGVSHFAPLQRPDEFNAILNKFLHSVLV